MPTIARDTFPIDVLAIESEDRIPMGRLGLCCCPGHRLMPRYVRPELGSLQADLDRIAAFRPRHVITLMEAEELHYIGVPAEALRLGFRQRSVSWLHLPIPNLRAPTQNFESLWAASGETIRRSLASGESVVLHCYAGLGRTGTIAARILVEFGLSPGAAVGRVRETRPGSIETREQELYLLTRAWEQAKPS